MGGVGAGRGPRPISSALGGGDISHDGRRIALVRAHEGRVMILTISRDGTDPRPITPMPHAFVWRAPRWSFDDAWLAFHGRGTTVWDERVLRRTGAGRRGTSDRARQLHARGVVAARWRRARLQFVGWKHAAVPADVQSSCRRSGWIA